MEEDGGGEYLPDPELRVPPGVLLPPNNKLYAVILKVGQKMKDRISEKEGSHFNNLEEIDGIDHEG